MTSINIYNLVIDVHLLEKLVFLKCNDCMLGLESYLVRTLAEIIDHLLQFVPI